MTSDQIKAIDILIVEPDAEAAKALSLILPWECRCDIVHTLQEAESILDSRSPSLLICADDLPTESGLMFFSRTRGKWSETRRILMVPAPEGEFFFLAMREFPPLYYVHKPVEKRELLHVMRHALHDVFQQDAPVTEEVKKPETFTRRLTDYLDGTGILAGVIVLALLILVIVGIITVFRLVLAA